MMEMGEGRGEGRGEGGGGEGQRVENEGMNFNLLVFSTLLFYPVKAITKFYSLLINSDR